MQHKLTRVIIFVFVMLWQSVAHATGVNEVIANEPMTVNDNSQVPSTGFLPYNPFSSLVTSMGCKVQMAGGNMASGANGANLLFSCDQLSGGRFIWVMQNNNQQQPRSSFEVRRDGFTRVNGLYAVTADSGFPAWNPLTPYGGSGGQTPTAGMVIIQSDLIGTNASTFQIYGTLRNYYSVGSNLPALATFFGYANTNGGTGMQGAKRFEILDNGATSFTGLDVPTLSCVAGGALPQTRYYVRYTLNMPVESLMSPPFYSIVCNANTLLKVTSPNSTVAMSWNVYVGVGGPATERLQATGANILMGTDWTEPAGGLSGSTEAPMYVQNGLVTMTGGYPCTGSPSICATLYIGGPTIGGTNNYAIYAPTGKSYFGVTEINASVASPDANPSSSFTSNGCSIVMAGGNLGNNAGGKSNVRMNCDMNDRTGRFFWIWNNDNSNQPHDFVSMRRDGFMNVQGLSVVQGNYSSNYPNYDYYFQNFVKNNNISQHNRPTFGVWTDVPSSIVPIVSFWGLTNDAYAGTRPPLYQHYGSTFFNSALYDPTIALSQQDGTLIESMEDNGNKFTTNLVRTVAQVDIASTTALANIARLGVPVLSGRTYAINAKLYVSIGAGGIKVALNSTATMTYIIYNAECINNATHAIVSAGQTTTLATAIANISAAFNGICRIEGTAVINAGGARTLAGTATSGSPTITMANTTGLVVGMEVTQIGVGADVLPTSAFITAIVPNTSITIDRNASANYTGNLNFWDTITVQAAQSTSDVANSSILRGSSLAVDGSINAGAY